MRALFWIWAKIKHNFIEIMSSDDERLFSVPLNGNENDSYCTTDRLWKWSKSSFILFDFQMSFSIQMWFSFFEYENRWDFIRLSLLIK